MTTTTALQAEVDRLERALVAAERDNDWPNVYRLEDEIISVISSAERELEAN